MRRVLLSIIGGFALSLVASAQQSLFSFNDASRQQLREHPQYANLLARADGFLKAEVLTVETLTPIDRRDARKAITAIPHVVGRRLDDWCETLGFAWVGSGDERYAQKGVELLCGTLANFPLEQPYVLKGFAGGRGDIMRGIAVGYGFFAEAMTPEQRDQVATAAEAYVNNFLDEANNPKTWWYSVHNYNGVCGGAAGLLTLAFAGYPSIASKQDECIRIMKHWFDVSIDKEGAYVEGAGYSQYGLSNSLLFAWLLRARGGEDLFKHPHVRQLPRFYAQSLLPGTNVMDARNDSNYGSVDRECLLLALANRDGLAAWLWQMSGKDAYPYSVIFGDELPPATEPTGLLPLHQHFPDRGLCVWRTGWSDRDVMFSTEAGPYYPVTHNQGDKGHFTLYAYGQHWAVDTGYGNDSQFADSRCHTQAHNCVLINGKGQARSGSGYGTNGKILAYHGDAPGGYALADCTEAYQKNHNGRVLGAGAELALRHHLFVRPERGAPAYAVVFDDIRKDTAEHRYTWQMLTWNDVAIEARPKGALFQNQHRPEGKSYVWTPAAKLDPSKPLSPAEAATVGSCSWEFETAEAGDWYLWGLVRAMGAKPGQSDSFVVQIDEQAPIDWHMPGSRSWTWGQVSTGIGAANRKPWRVTLPAGKHRLRFMTREPEAALSMVALTRDAEVQLPLLGGDGKYIALRVDDAAIAGAMERRPIAEDAAAFSRLLLAIDAATPLATPVVDAFRPTDGRHPAYYPRFGIDTTAVNPLFVAVLVPLPGQQAEPTVAFERSADAVEITVSWPTHRDVIRWQPATREQPSLTRK
ncbi:MAG: heparinase II/III domain-containing protein [Lentisphaeria bacterium]|jgi:opacity protein-like surface antigen